MKGKTWLTYLCSLGVVVLLLVGFGTVLAGQGGEDDPLITLSYLNDKLTPAFFAAGRQQVGNKRSRAHRILADPN